MRVFHPGFQNYWSIEFRKKTNFSSFSTSGVQLDLRSSTHSRRGQVYNTFAPTIWRRQLPQTEWRHSHPCV